MSSLWLVHARYFAIVARFPLAQRLLHKIFCASESLWRRVRVTTKIGAYQRPRDHYSRDLIQGCEMQDEAIALGYGGIAIVARATGLSAPTIRTGMAELADPATIAHDRIRRPGAGRKSLVDKDPFLLADLDGLIAPATRGDPECPLRWTSKSLAKIVAELQGLGHQISPNTVGVLLREPGYSL